jgi:hypothetical protein
MKTKMSVCLIALFFNISPVSAYTIDITISGLDDFNLDLGAFDFDVGWDQSGDYYYDSYTLTEHLGRFSLNEAVDLSDLYVAGSNRLNLSVISYLQNLDAQPSAFTLATLTFYGNQNPASDIVLSDIILSDRMGQQIGGYIVSGSHISFVPLPASIWLMGAALLGFAGIGKKSRESERQRIAV